MKPQRVIEVEQYDSALLLIASGYGMTVAPASARLISMPGIAYIPLIETLTIPMVMFHRKETRSRLLQQFFTALDEVRIDAACANTVSEPQGTASSQQRSPQVHNGLNMLEKMLITRAQIIMPCRA